MRLSIRGGYGRLIIKYSGATIPAQKNVRPNTVIRAAERKRYSPSVTGRHGGRTQRAIQDFGGCLAVAKVRHPRCDIAWPLKVRAMVARRTIVALFCCVGYSVDNFRTVILFVL
ncbi:uncharacterized protein PV09_00209 [Verruconis gallopava]|uniref:Uncharacterized protein n=1 Tax=Verruconis gallopava TaxID=253628 RepID=A0A0D1Z8F4_9PEZI|nr:uncharacterized protein PV09_00209 [Verruconis gallopava]KIW09292.1 hypothetical protein PV09_00209 [Verruconis gallopava]